MKNKTNSINAWHTVEKQLGQTPLEALEALREQHPEYAGVSMAYAGRLDPMAQGQLLVLVGEACKQRERFLGLDKEYEFEVLLGCESDTHDILGISRVRDTHSKSMTVQQIDKVIQTLLGRQNMPYPAFSSKTVDGKPLFLWALEGKIDEITRPTKEVEIYGLEYRGSRVSTPQDLWQDIQKKISRVSVVDDPAKQLGRDFRRKEVLETWQNNLETRFPNSQQFTILKFRCRCSSGTYMRSLAQMIGSQLSGGGLAWSIVRTKMGRYYQWGPLSWWARP